MNILAVNKFYHVFGGSDRYFFELNQLHEQAGHKVIPFAMDHVENYATTYQEYFVSEVKYWGPTSLKEKIRAGSRVFYSSEARTKIRKLIEASQPEIAHVHLIYHQISPAILPIIKEFDIPIIQTLHDYKPVCPTYSFLANGDICERCQGKHFFQATLQRCNHGSLVASAINTIEMYLHHGLGWYDLPDVYVTPSDFMRRKMITYGIPAEKVIHIPNFVDTKKINFSETNDNYFVYVGRLHKIKGLKTLLLAMQKLKSKKDKLLIIGDGPQKEALQKMKQDCHLDNVEFLGYMQPAQLETVIAQAKFNVIPSEWYENCPMSVLECMAMGKPTIGARIGGLPELIEDGVNGLLFESGNPDDLTDKIDYLLTNPQQLQAMAFASRKRAEEMYAAEVHYEQVMHLYKQVL